MLESLFEREVQFPRGAKLEAYTALLRIYVFTSFFIASFYCIYYFYFQDWASVSSIWIGST